MKPLNVLVGFEESQEVTAAFIALGHNAMSCDMYFDGAKGLPHYKGDFFDLDFSIYDLIIVHPPCTHISNSGNAHYAGTQLRQDAADFIWKVWNIPCEHLALENPVGQINTYYPQMPKPQYIQPYQFGHPESKKTGLWLRGLPELLPTNVLSLPSSGHWNNQTKSGQNKLSPSVTRAKERAKTYTGIAQAMANQWSKIVSCD